jgi:phosphohistidine swiveling domain-containing protein
MIVKKSSIEVFAKREAGGKGYNLYLLTQKGFPVPDWCVLGKRVFRQFLDATGTGAKIDAVIDRLQSSQIDALAASREIEALFVATDLPPAVQAVVRQGYDEVKRGLVSVRSSAADEDGQKHSFAGQLSSYLYVDNLADVERYVKLCWASGFSERCLCYRLENNLPLKGASVSVVLQRMIDPDKSGVLFTCDPVAGHLREYLICAVHGVGEGLVSGSLEADSYWIDADTGTLSRKQVSNKEAAFRRAASGQCESVPLAEARRDCDVLSQSELTALHDLGSKILNACNWPQDVEWAMADGCIHVLQTRPVTKLKKDLVGYLNLWDNSNIIESYGGLTSPLSFSFALGNYKAVYLQFCEVLNVPQEVIKDMDDYLGNMLGCLHGRVYYNLYNWYKLVAILPGAKSNHGFMETMMGVSESLSDEVAARIMPHPGWHTAKGRLLQVKTGISFLWYHFTIQKVVDNFLASFGRDYLKYRNHDYAHMRGDQIHRIYVEMERNMIGRWKAPIINDFLCMVHFGLLKKLTGKWLATHDPTILNDLLAGEGNLESAEPTKSLIRMAGFISARPALRTLIEESAAGDCMEALNQSPHQEFFTKVLAYIERFGFRCMNEMKLEEIDLYTDTSYLFTCLKNYLHSGTTDLGVFESREKALRDGAEQSLAGHLTGLRKIVYWWSLRHARKAVKNRENTRFARTRIYGVARSMFQAIGADLAARGIIAAPRDIFFLTLAEVGGVFHGTLACFDLAGLIALRQSSYQRFASEEPKTRVVSRGPVYWTNPILVSDDEDPALGTMDPDADLQGLPCCPGIVEGIVKVVMSGQDDLKLNGEILVTPRTDPGWVPLYPSCSALLVERGSLLSHSAIVAREMGLPAIVSIKHLTKTLKTGMRVRIDGKRGTIKILV